MNLALPNVEAAVGRELLQLALRNAARSVPALAVVVVLLVVIGWTAGRVPAAVASALLGLAACASRWRIARRYGGRPELSEDEIAHARRALQGDAALAGLWWAVSALGIYAHLQGSTAAAFVIFVCGSLTIAAMFMSLIGHSFLLLAVPQLGALALASLWSETVYSWQVAAMVPVLLLTTYRAAREFTATTSRSIRFGLQASAANASLQEATNAAEAANRAKSAFLATMSHELRTPMNGVVGMAEVLVHETLTPQQRDAIGTIRDSALSLLGLIDSILDFSKIEAGGMELERVPADVVDIVEGVCDALVPVAAARDVDLSVFIAPQVPAQIWSDPVRLRQILYNLVGNAIKFSSGPARRYRVAVRVDIVQDAVPRLSLRVADGGIGMTPQTLAGLFTPFMQAEPSITRRFGGTGLGLAICKRLVGLMYGELGVTSELGVGSVFTVELPVEVALDAAARGTELAGLDCLVVEDADFDARDLCVTLEHAGARCHHAADLASALLGAATLAPPVVLIQRVAHGEPWLADGFARAENLCHLFIMRGQRRRPRSQLPGVVSVDGPPLRRRALLHGVALASGRAAEDDARQRPAAADGDALRLPEALVQGRCILVAEDDSVNQKVIRRQLSLLGCGVEVAGNGVEALRLWRTGRHALLLTDLAMPEMNGYALVAAIRSEEAMDAPLLHGRRLPILALSANAMRGEAQRAHAAGIDDYLTKPVPLFVLRSALEKWLPLPQPGAEPAVSVTTAPGHVPVVDMSRLHALVGDDPEVTRDLMGDYLEAARGQANRMRAAFEAGDMAGLRATAHQLKSSSLSVGAVALGTLCAALEADDAHGGDVGTARAMARFDSAMQAMEAYVVSLLEVH